MLFIVFFLAYLGPSCGMTSMLIYNIPNEVRNVNKRIRTRVLSIENQVFLQLHYHSPDGRLRHIALLCIDYSFTHPPLSVVTYSFIQLSELKQHVANEIANCNVQ